MTICVKHSVAYIQCVNALCAIRCQNWRSCWKTLINNCKIEATQFSAPLVRRLDASHYHGIGSLLAFQSSRVDAHIKIRGNRLDLLNRLLKQFLDVGQHQDTAIPILHGIAAERGQQWGFA